MNRLFALCCLALVLFSLCILCSPAEEDNLIDDKYKILFLPETSIDEMDLESKQVVEMIAKDGKKYKCLIPLPEDKTEQEEKSEADKEEDKAKLKADILDKLETLRGHCIARLEGWWTYEFCYGKHVRQYHSEEDKVVAEFFLGRANAKKQTPVAEPSTTTSLRSSSQSIVQQEVSGSKPITYFSETYANGDICDLSGKPRETEIRYYCKDTSTTFFDDLKEPATCKYTVSINIASLCKLKLFKPIEQKRGVKRVICHCMPELAAA